MDMAHRNKKNAKPMQENHDKNNASAPPSLPQAKRTLRINAHQLFSIMKAFGPRKQKRRKQKRKRKTGPRDISNDNAVAQRFLGPLIQEGEHAGVDDVESAVGIALFNDAGDVDFTCTCRRHPSVSVLILSFESLYSDVRWKRERVGSEKGLGSWDRQQMSYLVKSSQCSHYSPLE